MEKIINMINFNEFFNVISYIMIVGIIIVFGLATYWNLKFLIIAGRSADETGIKIYCAFSTFIFFVVEIYVLARYITGHYGDISPFGTVVIRPAIFLVGGAAASTARNALTHLEVMRGGKKWISQKPRI